MARLLLTILVRITTDTRYTINTEIKIGQVAVNPFQERHQEASQAAIYVQAELVAFRKFREVGNGINRAVREIWSRADKHDCVWVTVKADKVSIQDLTDGNDRLTSHEPFVGHLLYAILH